MADSRSRKTGEHNAQLVALAADAVAMRAQIAALEERVLKLEAEVAAGRDGARGSKRPPVGPPPLPVPKGRPSTMPAMPKTTHLPSAPSAMPPAGRRGAGKSVVDISEIAELVESIPPPPAAGPPRPRK